MKQRILFFMMLALVMAWCGRNGARVHAQTRVAPDQIWGLSQLLVMSCAETPVATATSDCTGLMYVDLVKPNGTHFRILGTPPPDGFTIDPNKWSQVPVQ
jgi:hypothetical protein